MEDEVDKADEDDIVDNQSTVRDSKPASFLSPALQTPIKRTVEVRNTPISSRSQSHLTRM